MLAFSQNCFGISILNDSSHPWLHYHNLWEYTIHELCNHILLLVYVQGRVLCSIILTQYQCSVTCLRNQHNSLTLYDATVVLTRTCCISRRLASVISAWRTAHIVLESYQVSSRCVRNSCNVSAIYRSRSCVCLVLVIVEIKRNFKFSSILVNCIMIIKCNNYFFYQNLLCCFVNLLKVSRVNPLNCMSKSTINIGELFSYST